MTFNPATFPLEADLSRADVCVLYEMCAGKSVVEVGCGGSTVLLAQFAASLRSYETDPAWIERTQRRLSREPAEVQARCLSLSPYAPGQIPAMLPTADVYFIDCICEDRAAWLKTVVERRLAPLVLIHDSRSSAMVLIGPVLIWPLTLSLRSIEYHVDGSNLLLVRCDAPCEYVNWNEAEPANRLPFLS